MARILTGIVVSLKMQGTAIVEIVWKRPHPLYQKLMQRSKKYKVGVGSHQVGIGDTVKMSETRKLAKDKYFAITEIIKAKEQK